MTSEKLRIRVIPSIDEVPAAAWDACADPLGARRQAGNKSALHAGESTASPSAAAEAEPSIQPAPQETTARPGEVHSASAETAYNPFVSHDFLAALERSGSATRRTGWRKPSQRPECVS